MTSCLVSRPTDIVSAATYSAGSAKPAVGGTAGGVGHDAVADRLGTDIRYIRPPYTSPPAAWQAAPKSVPPAPGSYDVLPGLPSLTSYGNELLSVLLEHAMKGDRERDFVHYHVQASVRQIERASGRPIGPAVTLREWKDSCKISK